MTHFGSPKDIAVSYYDTIDDDHLLKKINLVKKIRGLLLISILIVILFIGYRSYILYEVWLESQKPVKVYEDQTIEYISPDGEDNNSTTTDNN